MDNEELRIFTLQLSRTKRVGLKTFVRLMAEFETIQNLYEEFCSNSGHDSLKKISLNRDTRIFNELKSLKIGYKCFWEDDYPALLKQINDPPVVLFYKGEWSQKVFERSFSVVGTRKFTTYGQSMTNKLVSQLVLKGYSIVSGMALGLDREAHLAALDNNGKTIAVLAADVSRATPGANSDIYRRILNTGGLIISEFAHDVKITDGMFVRRNRIVAGISDNTLITEAGIDSGALITANLAFDYNRNVFAVPGNVGRVESAGCNKLIKEDKAKLVEDINDILIEQNLSKSSILVDRSDIIEGLNEEELEVFKILLSESKLIEEISEILNKHVSDISKTCTLLELKGILKKEESGKYFIDLT